MVKQTAGRDQLGAFAPKFAQLMDRKWVESMPSKFGRLFYYMEE